MTDTIEPALTPEEWADALAWPHGLKDYLVRPAERIGYGDDAPSDLHRVAALALHGLVVDGKPVGFTRDHVALIRDMAEDSNYYAEPTFAAQVDALAAIIEALLPPEGK